MKNIGVIFIWMTLNVWGYEILVPEVELTKDEVLVITLKKSKNLTEEKIKKDMEQFKSMKIEGLENQKDIEKVKEEAKQGLDRLKKEKDIIEVKEKKIKERAI